MALHKTHDTASRTLDMLATALGSVVNTLLEDDGVIEVMLNPDGRLWVERLGEAMQDTDHRISGQDAERIIRLVASCRHRPIVQT